MAERLLRVATLNLRHGGGDRIAKLCAKLDSFEADILVLSEFRSGAPGSRVVADLRSRGNEVFCDGGPPPGINSVLVAARIGQALGLPLGSASYHRYIKPGLLTQLKLVMDFTRAGEASRSAKAVRRRCSTA